MDPVGVHGRDRKGRSLIVFPCGTAEKDCRGRVVAAAVLRSDESAECRFTCAREGQSYRKTQPVQPRALSVTVAVKYLALSRYPF